MEKKIPTVKDSMSDSPVKSILFLVCAVCLQDVVDPQLLKRRNQLRRWKVHSVASSKSRLSWCWVNTRTDCVHSCLAALQHCYKLKQASRRRKKKHSAKHCTGQQARTMYLLLLNLLLTFIYPSSSSMYVSL